MPTKPWRCDPSPGRLLWHDPSVRVSADAFRDLRVVVRMPPLVTYRQPLDPSNIRSARRSMGCLRIGNCLGWKPDGALRDLVVIHPLEPEDVATAPPCEGSFSITTLS